VKEGDIVRSFAGKEVHNARDLRELVEQATIGSKQPLEVTRDGHKVTMTVSLAALPENLAGPMRMHHQRPSQNDEQGTFHAEDMGLTVADMSTDQAATFKGFEGVVVQNVDDDSPAARKGLQPGMLIRKVGQTSVKNIAEFEAALKHESLKSGVMLEVRSGEGNHFVVLQKS
jgi:serine protease Do